MGDLKRTYRIVVATSGVKETDAAFRKLEASASALEAVLRRMNKQQLKLMFALASMMKRRDFIPHIEERYKEEDRWLRKLYAVERQVRREQAAEAKKRIREINAAEREFAREQQARAREYARAWEKAERERLAKAREYARGRAAAEAEQAGWKRWIDRSMAEQRRVMQRRLRDMQREFSEAFRHVSSQMRLDKVVDVDLRSQLERIRHEFNQIGFAAERALRGSVSDGRAALHEYRNQLAKLRSELNSVQETAAMRARIRAAGGGGFFGQLFSRKAEREMLVTLRLLRRGTVLTYHLYVKWLLLSGAIAGASAALSKFALDYNQMLERTQIGIAGVLTSVARIEDAYGRILSGAEKFQAAQALAGNILEELQARALRSVVTFEELATTFQAIAGAGLQAGMSLQDLIDIAELGAIAVGALGLQANQVTQELRDLVQGGIQMTSSSLAAALGITDSLVKKWKEQGVLTQRLRERLRGFGQAGAAAMARLDILTRKLLDAWKRLGGEAFRKTFVAVKIAVRDLLGVLIQLRDGRVEINPDLIESMAGLDKWLSKMIPRLRELVEAFVVGAKRLAEFIRRHWDAVKAFSIFYGTLSVIHMAMFGFFRLITMMGIPALARMIRAMAAAAWSARSLMAAFSVTNFAIGGLAAAVNIVTTVIAAGFTALTLYRMRHNRLTKDLERANRIYEQLTSNVKKHTQALQAEMDAMQAREALDVYLEQYRRLREELKKLEDISGPLTGTWSGMMDESGQAFSETQKRIAEIRKEMAQLEERIIQLTERWKKARHEMEGGGKGVVTGAAFSREDIEKAVKEIRERLRREAQAGHLDIWWESYQSAEAMHREISEMMQQVLDARAKLRMFGGTPSDLQLFTGLKSGVQGVMQRMRMGELEPSEAVRVLTEYKSRFEVILKSLEASIDAHVARFQEFNAQVRSYLDQQYDAWAAYALARNQLNEQMIQGTREEAEEQKRKHEEIKASLLSLGQTYSQVFGQMSDVLRQYGEHAKGSGMGFFNTAKALAMAQVIISTATSVMSAVEASMKFAALTDNPILGKVLAGSLAAMITAIGAAQLDIIARTRPQAHAGADYIPEDQTVLLKRGEMVLDPGTAGYVRRAARIWAAGRAVGLGGNTKVTVNVNVPVQGGVDAKTAALIEAIAYRAASRGIADVLQYAR